jgi:predicted choloylglycine hydrolase
MNSLNELVVSGLHHDVGLAIGQRFSTQIPEALDMFFSWQKRVLAYHRTQHGQATYQKFLDLNRARYSDYVAELEGMAEGTGRPFEELFLLNLAGEYGVHLRGLATGCSECAVLTPSLALMGHNEDGAPGFSDKLSIVRAQIKGKPGFIALEYPGFLCGNAFGLNEEGIAFTIDLVQPRKNRMGMARQFIARSLLEARSLDDAIARVTVPGRAGGFSYTIGSMAERRIVHVEVAPEAYAVREVEGVYFHTNHYRELAGVKQSVGSSSRTRVRRANELLKNTVPGDAGAVLAILGDRVGDQYPIYRTAMPPDSSLTYCTALFDLEARSLRIYTGHPVQDSDQYLEYTMP